jgi:hypothetical protein
MEGPPYTANTRQLATLATLVNTNLNVKTFPFEGPKGHTLSMEKMHHSPPKSHGKNSEKHFFIFNQVTNYFKQGMTMFTIEERGRCPATA